MNKLDKIIQMIKDLREDGAPTMAMGNGQIAGSAEAGDDPPVRKRKKYPTLGRGSRKPWLDALKQTP